jgi:hypothetical protein
MADVFLSYAREDRECAALLAELLSGRGWTIWWDRHIDFGRPFSEVIEYELDRAHCVVVLWSQHALRSEWVQNEAAEAIRRRVLVPVRIEDVRPPLQFRGLHSADLFDWRIGFSGREFEACLTSIARLISDSRALMEDGQRGLPTQESEVVRNTGETLVQPALTAGSTCAESSAQVETVPQRVPSEFWISQDGQQYPFPDIAMLQQWAEGGRVSDGSFVFDPRLQRWVRAREIAELRSAYRKPQDTIRRQPRRRRWLLALIALVVFAILAGICAMSVMRSRADSTAMTPPIGMSAMQGPTTAASSTVLKSTASDSSTTMPESAEAAKPNMVPISIENRCKNITLSVAVCYLDKTNQWRSAGWYNLDPLKTITPMTARGPYVYFYCELEDDTPCAGQSEPLARFAPVHKTESFDAPVDELNGDDVKFVPFLGGKIGTATKSYTQVYNCNPK